MNRLSNIITFTTIAETGSFVEAARRLNLANSVVSKRIKDLEDHLGTRLFNRNTRHVALTDAGYQYLEHTKRLIDELAEAEEQLRFQNENPVGEIKVSVPMTFGNLFLGPAISSFLQKYKDVSVRLLISDHHQQFAEDSMDVAVFIGAPEESTLIARRLSQTRLVTVASPAYLKEHGMPKTPQDLIRHNCLRYNNVGGGKSWPYRQDGRDIAQTVSGRFISDSGTLLCAAALEGCGITQLPSFIVGQYVVAGALAILLEEFERPPMSIQAVFPHQRHMSARLRKFIDHLAEYFSAFEEKQKA